MLKLSCHFVVIDEEFREFHHPIADMIFASSGFEMFPYLPSYRELRKRMRDAKENAKKTAFLNRIALMDETQWNEVAKALLEKSVVATITPKMEGHND